MIIAYKGKMPVIGKDVFIAPTAMVIGDVEIEEGSSIWYGTVVRGDRAPIRIGKDTNIQDNCTVHTNPEHPAVIGDRVSIGHNVVIHGCTIEDDSFIGIGATVLNGARVKKHSVVAANSLVREGREVGPFQLVAGAPAQFKREISRDDIKRFQRTAKGYRELAKTHIALYRENEG